MAPHSNHAGWSLLVIRLGGAEPRLPLIAHPSPSSIPFINRLPAPLSASLRATSLREPIFRVRLVPLLASNGDESRKGEHEIENEDYNLENEPLDHPYCDILVIEALGRDKISRGSFSVESKAPSFAHRNTKIPTTRAELLEYDTARAIAVQLLGEQRRRWHPFRERQAALSGDASL